MFAKPGCYDMIYSSLTPKIVPNNVPAPRGIGMKIFGIRGENFLGWGKGGGPQKYPGLDFQYSFCAQLLQNLEEQPTDDIGVEWDPKKYPFEQIVTLEFGPQDSWLTEFRVCWDDRITCNSWHGLKKHQPLGGTNRMRRVIYAEFRKLPLRVNGYKELHRTGKPRGGTCANYYSACYRSSLVVTASSC
jgi:hypothetical protein